MTLTKKLFSAATYLLLFSTLCAWESNPKSGWNFNYEASCGLRPDQVKNGSRKMIIRGYQNKSKDKPGFASMISDQDKQVVLRLINNGTDERFNRTPGKFAHFYLPLSSDSKSKSTQASIDFKFKLGSATENKAQFSLSMVSRAAKGKQSPMVWITFARDKIFYLNKNKAATKKYALANTWHIGRVHIDLVKNIFSLFIDKNPSPVFSAELSMVKGAPKLQFGDGSSGVAGSVDLAYVRLSEEELVPVGASK